VSALIRRRLFTISAIRFGEMPTARASRFCDSPYSLRNSSRSISPGVTGANSSAVMAPPSVIVDDRDLVGVTVGPAKDDPPLVVDPDRTSTLSMVVRVGSPWQGSASRWQSGRCGPSPAPIGWLLDGPTMLCITLCALSLSWLMAAMISKHTTNSQDIFQRISPTAPFGKIG
jgi:hypothetical protein